MNHLDKLENESIFIIREAFANYKNMGMLWSIGKDSTTMLWLCRKAFFGKIPFPLIHIDTSYKFDEIYEFRDMYVKKWDLDLVIARNDEAINDGMSKDKEDALACCSALKTQPLKDLIKEKKYEAVLVGIRRDEHGIRAKERVFSKRDDQFVWNYRNQDAEIWNHYKLKKQEKEHLRIHPLLAGTVKDIWDYINR